MKLIAKVIIILIIGTLTMLLWNWLMPVIFGLTKITFLQSVGLMFLVRIFFDNINNNQNF